MGVPGYENGFEVTLHPERLGEPLRRAKPTTYFVNSMSDLFHERVPNEFTERVLDVITQARQHRFQILTKRPDRLATFAGGRELPDNAWMGVSVENKRHGVPRISVLRTVEARIRFLSVEPLLEDIGRLDLAGIDWVIVGGESGPKARRMDIQWARNVRDQCIAAGIPFFFKQWGTIGPDGVRRSKASNGHELDGCTWHEMPQ
jgi:protein gp37